MGFFFNSHQHDHSHIDRSTGRNKRDKGTVKETRGVRPDRHNGRIISRAEWRREQKTGVKQSGRWW